MHEKGTTSSSGKSREDRLLTIKQLSSRTRISAVTLQRLAKKGRLPVVGRTEQEELLIDPCAVEQLRKWRAGTKEEIVSTNQRVMSRLLELEYRMRAVEMIQNVGLPRIGKTEQDILYLYWELGGYAERTSSFSHDERIHVARKILAITAPVFALVEEYLGDENPWKLFMQAVDKALVFSEHENIEAESRGMFELLTHARQHLKEEVFFFLCEKKGVRFAEKQMPSMFFQDKHRKVLNSLAVMLQRRT